MLFRAEEADCDPDGPLPVRSENESKPSVQSELRAALQNADDLQSVCRGLTVMDQSQIRSQVQKLKSPIKE